MIGYMTQAAAYTPDSADPSARHIPERDVEVTTTAAQGPTINRVARQPVEGLRAIRARVLRTGIPRLPIGPSRLALRRSAGSRAITEAPAPFVRTGEYTAAPSVEQVPDWYEFLV